MRHLYPERVRWPLLLRSAEAFMQVEDRREQLDVVRRRDCIVAQLAHLLKDQGARATSELSSVNLHLVEDDIGVLHT
ncbi:MULTISPECIES: hypothetical protein [unclassified Mesorhizobium]|uniref:hypothetical protein n=1 Tax=unclassified Mesorhizobium TaxID=325217 RepID=UPI000480B1A7|nr:MULTISPECIES: hypothetical protein [unclassified Mesorhizobium]